MQPATVAQQWSKRPPAVPRRRKAPSLDDLFDDSLIMLDGRMFFVAGYTSGGAPYGAFVDEPAADEQATEDEALIEAGNDVALFGSQW